MFTIVESRTTISCATPSRASTAQRLAAGAELAAAAIGEAPIRSLLAIGEHYVTPQSAGASARGRLERRNLVVDFGSVVEAVLVPAGSREEELDAVATHAVVAGVEGRAPDGADGALAVGA